MTITGLHCLSCCEALTCNNWSMCSDRYCDWCLAEREDEDEDGEDDDA